MHIKINESELIAITNCDVMYFSIDQGQITYSKSKSKNDAFSIHNNSYGLIIKNLSDISIRNNFNLIKEKSFITTGDDLLVNDHSIKLIDENKLPLEKNKAKPSDSQKENSAKLLTSVTGVRSFNKKHNGELFLVAKGKSFKNTSNDFKVQYSEGTLKLISTEDSAIMLNGNRATFSDLRNGDIIKTQNSKYIIESPGISTFSKYSPSHPRNMQLTEEYSFSTNDSNIKKNLNYFKQNSWWLSMIAGLAIIMIVLVIIKNSTA